MASLPPPPPPVPASLNFQTYFSAYHPQRTDALTKLDSLATFEDGFKYWRVALEDFERENPWTQLPNSANIEMTSYALLSHFLADDNGQKFDDSIPVVEWLFSQQTTGGGKKSLPLFLFMLLKRYFYFCKDIKF